MQGLICIRSEQLPLNKKENENHNRFMSQNGPVDINTLRDVFDSHAWSVQA